MTNFKKVWENELRKNKIPMYFLDFNPVLINAIIDEELSKIKRKSTANKETNSNQAGIVKGNQNTCK